MTPEQILKEADHCVKCGLCLPHCPTYRLSRDEGESPRGRVTLIQALASGALEPGDGLRRHLSNCLACRACESACPSGVRYGELIDGANQLLFSRGVTRPDPLARLVARRAAAPGGYRLARLYRQSGLAALADRLPNRRLRRLNALLPAALPDLPAPKPFYPALGERRAATALFTGCVGRVAERRALHAAIRVLTRLGRDVHLPPAQGCCGALAWHGGDRGEAARLAKINRDAFDGLEVEAVLTLSSGCGAQLVENTRLGTGLRAPVMDASHFVAGIPWPEQAVLAPLPDTRVALHTPCSLKHGMRQARGAADLLARIPGLHVEPLEGLACCGAAGSHMLTHAELADAVREPLLDRLEALAPGRVVSSNVGCALHLAAGLRQRGLSLEVAHPLELVDRQLGDPSRGDPAAEPLVNGGSGALS